jgi:hypothetical protein
MRLALGDGYADALRAAHSDVVETADFVMYWWNTGAGLARANRLARFGLITTSSITQTFNRKVVASHLDASPPLSIVFAVPNHPWVEIADGADVRIAMTVGQQGSRVGQLAIVRTERDGEESKLIEFDFQRGKIHSDLSAGADVAATCALLANDGLTFMGVTLIGDGFRLTTDDLIHIGAEANASNVVKPFVSGKELVQTAQNRKVIDFFGMSDVQARRSYPHLFQWLMDRVKPEREQNPREIYRSRWWIFGEPRQSMRIALAGLPRYIATCRTSKHRTFLFLANGTVPESKVVSIASDDALVLGIVSSRIHLVWALVTGGWLGVGNDPTYNHVDCFNKFPFPVCTDVQKQRIRELGESLDAHRKRQQALHPGLTITDMYNVLEKLRKNEELTDKDRVIHEQGLVSVLKQIHDDLDSAVADAYGWPIRDTQGRPTPLSDEEILRRLVALNAERAEEEKHGLIRWLRPEFQNPSGIAANQGTLGLAATGKAAKPKKAEKIPWPKSLAEQAQAVRAALGTEAGPASASELSKRFKGAKADRIGELLATLMALGQARSVGGERFVA